MKRVSSLALRGVLVIVATGFLSACGGKQMSIEEFQSMAREAEERSSSIANLQEEVRDILQSYNQTVGESRLLVLQLDPDYGLSEEEITRLERHIDSETDASCRDLLHQILGLQQRIGIEHARLHEITERLPEPHRVVRGENHYSLCLHYLTEEHGLSRAQADSLVARVALSGDIIEGFHVWFYYQNGLFGTFVTQGEAHISPTVFAKVVKKHLIDQARREGRGEAFEQILDSLRCCGALLVNVKHAGPGL
ncbi:MAG: hypothetical protein JXA28_08030 [Bacteroidetes bacterium]|nr:hypothetical protein [Bacteroidota bacterium]